jgi:hypothetical protein
MSRDIDGIMSLFGPDAVWDLAAEVTIRYAVINVWVEGLIERSTNYTDIDEARAAAERLAEE